MGAPLLPPSPCSQLPRGCPLAPAPAPGVINGPWELIPGQLGLPEPPRHLGRAALFHLVIYRDGPLPPSAPCSGQQAKSPDLQSTARGNGAQQHGGAGHRAPISQRQKLPQHQLRVALTPKSSCEGPLLPLPAPAGLTPRRSPGGTAGFVAPPPGRGEGSSQIAQEIRSPRKQRPCPRRDQQRLRPPRTCLSANPGAAESRPPSCPCPTCCDPAGGDSRSQTAPAVCPPARLLPCCRLSLLGDRRGSPLPCLEAGDLFPGS